jgi:outer membrane lipoprotein-sorting protein
MFQSISQCLNFTLKFIVILCIGYTLLALPAAAQGGVEPFKLNDRDRADIKRIEDYLNGIDTLKSRFIQMTSQGETSQGEFYLSRPGRLRIAYDPPVPVLIVSNGTFLLYLDTKLDQTSYTTLSSTPASVLVKENLRLNKDGLIITAIDRDANSFRISLKQEDDPYSGAITLIFSDKPLMLRQWTVLDAQGTTVEFALIEPRFGLELDPELFRFSMLPKERRRE